jgi:hypothetical protein
MNSRLKTLTELQLMVSGLEADLGISEMSEIERKVLLSLSDVYAKAGVAATGGVISHPMLSKFSRPSLFRALKALEAAGKVTKVTNKRGYYAPITK